MFKSVEPYFTQSLPAFFDDKIVGWILKILKAFSGNEIYSKINYN